MSDIPSDIKPGFVAEKPGRGSTSISDRPTAPTDSPVQSIRFPREIGPFKTRFLQEGGSEASRCLTRRNTASAVVMV